MDEEMRQPRHDAVDALSAPSFLVPWAFEYTPGSSDAVDATYLRKVREADVVIWLVGSRTTDPVVREVREAIAYGVPLVVIRLATRTSDWVTEGLIGEVGDRAKRVTVPLQDVRTAVALTMGDEIVRAWRHKPQRRRAFALEHLGRFSRARCIERWRAAGLTRAEALALADDFNVGRPSDEIRPTAEQPLRVIEADVGSGKSLCGERLLQEAIALALQDADAPIPVWIAARDARDLVAQIEVASADIGNLRHQGATVVVDGADEATATPALSVLSAARIAVETWPNTRIVITTRPLAAFNGVEERVRLPLLGESASLDLVQIVAKTRVASRWPPAVRDAIRRPLFAILLGLWLRSRPESSPRSTGEMLRRLVDRALAERGAPEAEVFRRLARLATDAGEAPVRAVDVGTRDQVDRLRESGLVVERDGTVSFGLPILTQWFAAQALAQREVSIAQLLANESRLDLWRYALVIAVGALSLEQASELLEPLVLHDPGFVSEVLHEAVEDYGSEPIALGDAIEIGTAIRIAAAAWLGGLSSIAPLMAISRSDSTPVCIGVSVFGESVTAMWRPADDLGEDVVELPHDANILSADSGWGPGRGSRPGREAAWPWRWALEDVAAELTRLIQDQQLPVADGPLFEEEAWAEGLALLGHGSLSPGPLPVDEIEKLLAEIPEGTLFRTFRRLYRLRALRTRIQSLRTAGEAQLPAPWPTRDRNGSGGWVWSGYSRDRLLDRTRAVYAAALQEYVHLVEMWLPALAHRMATYVTLPAVFQGTLLYNRSTAGFEGGPILNWHFEALPSTEVIRVEIALADQRKTSVALGRDGALERAEDSLRQHRPQARSWLYASTHGVALDVFGATPATDVAYSLIERDLQRIRLYG
jgi:hypothetical protein